MRRDKGGQKRTLAARARPAGPARARSVHRRSRRFSPVGRPAKKQKQSAVLSLSHGYPLLLTKRRSGGDKSGASRGRKREGERERGRRWACGGKKGAQRRKKRRRRKRKKERARARPHARGEKQQQPHQGRGCCVWRRRAAKRNRAAPPPSSSLRSGKKKATRKKRAPPPFVVGRQKGESVLVFGRKVWRKRAKSGAS